MAEYFNGYYYQINLTEDVCQNLFPAAFYFSYQLVRVYEIILCFISIYSSVYFFSKFKNHRCLHFNIKILFYLHFVSCFMQASVVGTFQIHHFITRIFAETFCDVVLPPLFHETLQVLLDFSLICSGSSLIFLIFERTLASYWFNFYGKLSELFGIFLATVAGLAAVMICIFIFYDTPSNYPQMSVLVTSPKNTEQVNAVLVFVIVLYSATVFNSMLVYRHNKRRNSSIGTRSDFGLDSQYQMTENVTSSRLVWVLASAQLSIYLIYAVLMFLLRIYIPKPRPGMWQVITELCYTPPIYCAIMPILCICTIRKSEQDRNQMINSLVGMNTTGKEGAKIYLNMLRDQWA